IQIAILSKQIYRYTWEREDVMLILSVTGIDMFSPMLITVEIVDIRRFSTPFSVPFPFFLALFFCCVVAGVP
ncbi:MAG: hypothetical protein ACRD5J_20295, partial [Nitrososphaeraceae archaeon]